MRFDHDGGMAGLNIARRRRSVEMISRYTLHGGGKNDGMERQETGHSVK